MEKEISMYDLLIVGAGLYGAVFAREAAERGLSSLVIDRRGHIAGNVWTEKIEGIDVHRYGEHIFHTNDKRAWDYSQRFAKFNRFTTIITNKALDNLEIQILVVIGMVKPGRSAFVLSHISASTPFFPISAKRCRSIASPKTGV